MAKNSAKKRQQFIDAATAFLAQNHGASLSEIAEQIGVGRATLQRYFPKRQDLLRDISLEGIRKMDEAFAPLKEIEQSAEESLRTFFETMLPLGDAYHFLGTYPDLIAFPEVAQAYEQQLAELRNYVRFLKQNGVIALDVPDGWAVVMIDLLIWGMWSAIHDGAIARNDAANLAVRTLMNGLSTSDLANLPR